MAITNLYLIRHCQTRAMAGEEVNSPRNDSSLSQHGQAQAIRLAAWLCQYPGSLFLTSRYQRAQETTKYLNAQREQPIFSDMALNPSFLRDDGSGVETTEQGLARSMSFLYQFSPYYQQIAVVGHDSILATIYMHLLTVPFSQGKDAFVSAGTSMFLRNDYSQGDQRWKHIETLVP